MKGGKKSMKKNGKSWWKRQKEEGKKCGNISQNLINCGKLTA